MKDAISAEDYISGSGKWEEALRLLREIIQSSGLTETMKWGGPVYTFRDKNIVGMAAFKSYAGMWFYQGVQLSDTEKKLVNAQEGITKALRQWRFGSAEEIRKEQDTIRDYIAEAISNHKQGKDLNPEKKAEVALPAELERLLEAEPILKRAFGELSTAKKRDFASFITLAKQLKTKQERLEKIAPMILRGEGLNDKYKK